MFNRLRSYLRNYPSLAALYANVHKIIDNSINDIRDIRDSYLLKTQKAKVTPYGFKLLGSSSIHHRGMQKGSFEEEETAIIRQHLNQSDAFIDIGANIGFYSCLARSLGKQVIAVEPLPRNLDHLYANLLENNWNDVEVYPMGLSDSPGLAVLYGASSTGASLIGNWAGASKRFRRIISLSTLDILLSSRFSGKNLLIKIDVEGFEYQVLTGALKTIQMTPRPTWLIEICLHEFYPNGNNPNFASTFELFWKNGYEIRPANRSNRVIRPEDIDRWIKSGRSDSGVINYLFIPERI